MTIVCAFTLKKKLYTKLAVSRGHNILTPGQPDLARIPQRRVSSITAYRISIVRSHKRLYLRELEPASLHPKADILTLHVLYYITPHKLCRFKLKDVYSMQCFA